MLCSLLLLLVVDDDAGLEANEASNLWARASPRRPGPAQEDRYMHMRDGTFF